MGRSNIDYMKGATVSPEKIAWLEAHAPAGAGDALDLGCGARLYSKWLAQKGWRVQALDLDDPPAIPGVRPMAHDLEGGLPFPDQ